MSWASSLCDLYDANAWRTGEVEMWNGKPLTLIPLGYDTMEAQIEITIDGQGNFINARALKKAEAETLVPYPEARTSGKKALPLFDKLIYIAGDYERFVTSGFEKAQKCYMLYIKELKAWCASEYTHPKVRAIFDYVSKKSVMQNLIDCSIIKIDTAGLFDETVKIQSIAQTDAFVRFRVFIGGVDYKNALSNEMNEHDSAVWLDKTVHKHFFEYYMSSDKSMELCYVSGKRMRSAKNSPAKIRNKGDQTRLISSNDEQNFTYRGRFKTISRESGYNEAMSVGYETSQKMHNALKWIIRRQGYVNDGMCIVAWESSLNDIPRFYDDAATIIGTVERKSEEMEIADDVLFDVEKAGRSDTNYTSAKDLNMAIDGYLKELNDLSTMVVLSFDSALKKGRLAVTYYKELATSRYLENIRAWQESCCWQHEYIKDKCLCRYEGMASISETAKAVYGVEQNKRVVLRSNTDGKCPMLISVFDRLRPCVIDRAAIPRDIVRNAVEKASNPVVYKKKYNYLRALHVACSLVKRYYWEKGVIFDMKLDEKCTDRSYLFGRLLSVAEKVERSTFEYGETRTTNAERYMQQFSRTPFRTWELIRRNTQIYLKQLKPNSREYYKNLYCEITELFKEGDFESKKVLDGRFILGYDCQRTALKYRKDDGTNRAEDEPDNTEREEN